MDETSHEKLFLTDSLDPSSGTALGLFYAGYGRKQTCSQIRQKYLPSFKSMQYKTLWMKKLLNKNKKWTFSFSMWISNVKRLELAT